MFRRVPYFFLAVPMALLPVSAGIQHIIMLPQAIIMGIPMAIMRFMLSQHSFIMAVVMPPMGVILQTMVLPIISQVMFIIMLGIIIGIIMPPIMGCCIMPPIIGIAFMFIMAFLRFVVGPVKAPALTNAQPPCIDRPAIASRMT